MYAQGKFTITVRDKDTLEEKNVIEANNIITQIGEWKMHRERSMLASEHGYYDDIVISSEKVMLGVDVHRHQRSRYGSGTNLQSPKWYEPTETTPGYVELYQRFQPSGTRTINSIYIGDGSSEALFAYAALVEPCIQADTEVLDIYYRVQFIQGDIGYDNELYSPTTAYSETLYRQNAYGGGQWNGTAYYATPHWGKVPPPNQYYTVARHNWDYRYNLQSINSRSWNDYNWQVTNTWSRGTTSDIGRVYSWLAWGYNSGTTNGYRSGFHTPLLPADFPYKPIQPIHRHSVNAPTPFLDVDYLATSTGILDVNGDNWTRMDDGLPEFHRIDFRKTGAVGEATYAISDRKTLGFYGTYYNGTTVDVGTGNYRPYQAVFPYLNERYDAFKGHGVRNIYDFTEFDDEAFIMQDETGITILDAATGVYENWDADSTPALPVTNLYQVASENQIIYAACADTGLWKIENAFDDTTATVITHLHNTSGCYGVDIAINEEVMALVDGGLIHSTDFGATWTTYNETTTPAFSHPGITDNQWFQGRGIYIDRESTDYQMIVMYFNDSDELNNRASTIWWSMSGGAIFLNTWSNMLHSIEGRPRTSRVKCSRYGSFWIINNHFPYRLTPNEAVWALIGHGSDYQRGNNVTFFYDNYGTPYTWAFFMWDGSSNQPGIYRKDGAFMGVIDAWGYIDSHNGWRGSADGERTGSLFSWEYNKGNGFALTYRPGTSNDGYQSDAYRMTSISSYFWNYTSHYRRYGVRTDAWNGIGTPFEDFMWKKYGWNGSEWVDGYLVDAVDSSGNGNDGTRKNFHPGDAEFYGNAVIESPVLADFSSATIAANVSFDIRRPYANGVDSNTLWALGGVDQQISQRHYVTPPGDNTTITRGDGYHLCEDNWWHRKQSVIETEFHDIDWIHYFMPGMYNFTNSDGTVVRMSEFDANEEHRLVNTFEVKAGGENIINGRHAVWRSYYATGTGNVHDYDPITDKFTFSYVSHTSGEYYGMNAWFRNIHPLQTEDFRISFDRTCSLTTRQNGTKLFSYASSALMFWLIDGEPGFTGGSDWGWCHQPRPPGSIEGTYMAIALPTGYNQQLQAPRIYTRIDAYDDETANISYTNMTEVTPWEEGDFDGTNTLDIDWTHNGTTYEIAIYSAGVLRYTGIANAGGYNVARPTGKPQFIIHWQAGESSTCSDILGGFKMTAQDGSVLTTSGTALAAKTYVDGVLVDAYTMPITAPTWNGITWGAESPRFGHNSFYENNFKGTATDLGLWNVALTDAQVADESTAPAHTILYTNVDDDYMGETKVTHEAAEPTISGLTAAFSAGASEPSFVRSDYFTHGVVDGLLKDNAISFSGEFNWYTKKLQEYTSIEDPADSINPTPVIPATESTDDITDFITWVRLDNCIARPGRVVGTYGSNSWSYNNAFSHDHIPSGSDGSIEFKPTAGNTAGIMFGFDQRSDLLEGEFSSYGGIDYAIHLSGNRVYIYENGTHRTAVGDTGRTYEPGDTFRIDRVTVMVDTTPYQYIKYYHNDTLIYTSTVTSSGNLWACYNSYYVTSNSIYDCKMTTKRKPYVLYLGDIENKEGRWNDDFILLEREVEGYSVSIDGVPQIVTLNSHGNRMCTMDDPVEGEVVIHREAGIIKFNPIEAGKTVNVTYRCIQRK